MLVQRVFPGFKEGSSTKKCQLLSCVYIGGILPLKEGS